MYLELRKMKHRVNTTPKESESVGKEAKKIIIFHFLMSPISTRKFDNHCSESVSYIKTLEKFDLNWTPLLI